MNQQQALAKMVAPGTPRKGKYRNGVIQIHLTNACDKSCYHCTQGSNLRGPYTFITVENFELACKSLEGYWGVIGVFGGNPCLHPQFDVLCGILREYFPMEQRGLWSNNLLKPENGIAARQTFDPKISNLNVHLDSTAYRNFKEWWPESMPFGLTEDSRHSPVYVAMKDVVWKQCPNCQGRGYATFDSSGNTPCHLCKGVGKITDEERIWDLISGCDINQHWSAMVCQIKGKLYAYFCEIAGAQAILHANDPDWPITGLSLPTLQISYDNEYKYANPLEINYDSEYVNPLVVRKWWELPMSDFTEQVKQHCFACGVPLRGYGELAQATSEDAREQTSKTHASFYLPKKKGREVEIVTHMVELGLGRIQTTTKYLQNSHK